MPPVIGASRVDCTVITDALALAVTGGKVRLYNSLVIAVRPLLAALGCKSHCSRWSKTSILVESDVSVALVECRYLDEN